MDKLLVVHGYNPEGMDGGKPFDAVVYDRLSTAGDLADDLDSYDLAITGGGDYDGLSESEIVYEIAEEAFPDLVDTDVMLEEESNDTESFVDAMSDYADEQGYDMVHVVSSKDHGPRVLREWVGQDMDAHLSVVPSDERYSANEKDPYIVEGAYSGDLIDALNESWGHDPAELAQHIRAFDED